MSCRNGKTNKKKVRYRDELAARMALARTRSPARRKSNRTEARVYKCPACGGWHLTSKK